MLDKPFYKDKPIKVFFIVPYPIDTAPSQRLKFEQYFEYFEEHNVEIAFSSFVTNEFRQILYQGGHFFKKAFYTMKGYLKRIKDLIHAKNFDIIYIHLEAAPFGPPIFEYFFWWMGKPIIYDIDDLVYLPHSSKANWFVEIFRFSNKFISLMKMSSHIIVVTKYLKEYAEKFNKNVTYIPSSINTQKYFVKNKIDNKKICIGWTGSHSTSEYLLLLENVLKQIVKKYDVRIKVVGDKNFMIKGLNMEVKDWSPETEIADIQEMDIGVYPVPKCEWVMGKGGLKALQYMGMGIPVICTKIGEVVNFIQDGANGFLADSEQEWIEKISRLIEGPKLRNEMGMAGRKTVEERFSVKSNAPIYLSILEKVYEERYGNK